jgi:REP element-mobilizing transposase RayT
MGLNEVGKIAHKYWKKIEELHDFVKLDAFVIMPNHVHGIIVINNPVGVCQWQTPTDTNIKNIQLPKKGIPSLINHYKGAVKKWASKNEHTDFAWQRNYHEHIIRNEKSWEKIQDYIIHNSEGWEQDEFFV